MSARSQYRSTLSRGVAMAAVLVASLSLWSPTSAHAAPPGNDDAANAFAVSNLPFSTTVDTSEATFSADDPYGCGVATVWYSFTPSITGEYTVRATSLETRQLVAVRGRPFGDECYRTASADVSLTAGSTYLIMVGTDGLGEPGQAGPGGSVTLTVDGPFPPFATTVTIDSAVLGVAPHTLEVSGTLSCNRRDASTTVSGSVLQVRGRRVAEAFFSFADSCPEIPTRWTATANTAHGSVLPGPATISARSFACSLPACAEASTQVSLQIRAR